MDLKREFLGYLRSVYGGDPMPMSQTSLPPLDSPVIYPAFRDSGLNEGLGLLGGMQQPMTPTGFNAQPALPGAAMGQGRQGMGQSGGLMQAQDVLLGR